MNTLDQWLASWRTAGLTMSREAKDAVARNLAQYFAGGVMAGSSPARSVRMPANRLEYDRLVAKLATEIGRTLKRALLSETEANIAEQVYADAMAALGIDRTQAFDEARKAPRGNRPSRGTIRRKPR